VRARLKARTRVRATARARAKVRAKLRALDDKDQGLGVCVCRRWG
jgi:hypothetical protein